MMEKLKNNINNYFSTGPKVIFIVVLLCVGITVGFYSTRKTVYVSIDGKESKIVTYKNSFKKALAVNKISVGPKDKTTPSLDSRVNNGDKINIKRAVNVEVAVDGKQLKIKSAEDTIEKMFEAENITVDDYDKVSPSKQTTLKDGIKVSVTRVKIDLVKENKAIDFAVVQKPDDNMERGMTKLLQEGQNGERQITTKIVYEDGKEIARQVVSEIVTKQPVQKIVASGTLGVLNLSRGGSKVLYNKSIKVRATAYCKAETGGARTASGTSTRRNQNGYSSIAVDPRVVPLGTKVYVEGYGYAIAEDTGGAIQGNVIDLYFDSSSEMNNWGSRYVNVYFIK